MSPEANEQAVDSIAAFDPWGLRRVEKLLGGLDGVDSLKMVPDGSGGIDEIHVLSGSDLTAKQIVRNVESALLAQFGLQIDHRKISVARLKPGPDIALGAHDAPAPGGAAGAAPHAEASAAAPAAQPEPAIRPDRRFLVESIEIERKAGLQVTCRVRVENGNGEEYVGEAEGPDSARSRLSVAAAAALRALEEGMDEDVSLAVDGVNRVEAAGRDLVAAVVRARAKRRKTYLAGVACVDDSPEEAAVHACLHATNRWIAEI